MNLRDCCNLLHFVVGYVMLFMRQLNIGKDKDNASYGEATDTRGSCRHSSGACRDGQTVDTRKEAARGQSQWAMESQPYRTRRTLRQESAEVSTLKNDEATELFAWFQWPTKCLFLQVRR